MHRFPNAENRPARWTNAATGTWQITYNGKNRPIRFRNEETDTTVECAYDSQGRRFEKNVSVAGTTTLRERYLYKGYLQVAAFDVSESEETLNYTLKRIIYWDPIEPTATRPLAINVTDDGLYFPTVDLTKNVCELVDAYGDIAATYDYAPFGAVTAGTPSGSAVPANPLQWSSEVYDSELDLIYYNYRHYSPSLGRFLSRDPIEEQGGLNLYAILGNTPIVKVDIIGLKSPVYRPPSSRPPKYSVPISRPPQKPETRRNVCCRPQPLQLQALSAQQIKQELKVLNFISDLSSLLEEISASWTFSLSRPNLPKLTNDFLNEIRQAQASCVQKINSLVQYAKEGDQACCQVVIFYTREIPSRYVENEKEPEYSYYTPADGLVTNYSVNSIPCRGARVRTETNC